MKQLLLLKLCEDRAQHMVNMSVPWACSMLYRRHVLLTFVSLSHHIIALLAGNGFWLRGVCKDNLAGRSRVKKLSSTKMN
jgi:hypothetical protein